MRICVTCVYWTLLFISVASSALLFIIVASENAQTSYYSSYKSNQTLESYDNEMDSVEHDDLELSNIAIAKLQDPAKLATTDYKDNYYQDKFAKEDFETVIKNDRRSENSYGDPDIAESFTPQPNLSQGISESGEAAVLTLVDTTTTDLQGLMEPRFHPEYARARLFANMSPPLSRIQQKTMKKEEEISASTKVPSLPSIDEMTEESNESSVFEEEPLLTRNAAKSEEEAEAEEVVVVRAEQGPIVIDGTDSSVKDAAVDEASKIEEAFTTTAELSDTEAKAQLVERSGEEAATIVFRDGIVPAGSTDSHEDIPSFNEWTQKRLEEAEKKKMHPNASVQSPGTPSRGAGGMKVRSKNYASPDCGAKIVAANPEARSARSVLASTRDEYMLNTCTSRIWFVVELCEAIQAKKIELANFELFSSSPKDFSVYISDRFPTRDWSLVGQFAAKDVKDIQSFVLQPHLFGKFVKIELQTYYGSEHFCPVSLFRAYGTSEFEVLETETESQISRNANANAEDDEDSDEEEALDVESGEPPRNLFGSARDAVLSIVKKAAEVLVKSSELTGNNITKIQQSIDSDNILDNSFASCTTPRYTILCDNCSDQKFAKIFQLVSCREQQLNKLLKIDVVNRTLQQSGFCTSHGVRIEPSVRLDGEEVEKVKDAVRKYKQGREKIRALKNFKLTFLTSVFKPEYIAALCNVLAIKERKMVMNTSYEVLFNNSKDVDKQDKPRKTNEDYAHEPHASTTSADSRIPANEQPDKFLDASTEPSESVENPASQIKPSRTLDREEVKNDSSTPTLKPSKNGNEETTQTETATTPASSHTAQHSAAESLEPSISSDLPTENSQQTTVAVEEVAIDGNEVPQSDVAADTDASELSAVQPKPEKAERPDQEEKQKQAEISDQEIKLSSPDSLAFDSLLSDLKDLEGETMHMQNGPAANPTAHSATNNMPQKESVFLRLSNRIKALERNMSLSGQYLEELSRRYKKQVEEMQKLLERTVLAMNEKSRKWEERESKRVEEITSLREDIVSLSKSVKNLLYDRDSWHGKLLMIGQHILIICSEVFVIFLVLLYCRGSKQWQENGKQQLKKDATRRKSAENFSSHARKTKKRRPSEIASSITGTYRDLMIEDKSGETKKSRRKKRKKDATGKGNVSNDGKGSLIVHCRSVSDARAADAEVASRKSSSVEALIGRDSQPLGYKRPKSLPENTIDWFKSDREAERDDARAAFRPGESDDSVLNGSRPSSVTQSDSLSLEKIAADEQSVADPGTSVLYAANSRGEKLSPSSFMKTALSTRKKRKLQSHDVNGKPSNSVERRHQFNYSDDRSARTSDSHTEGARADNSASNGLLADRNDESRSPSDAASKKKEKKNTGFRKMVRKLF